MQACTSLVCTIGSENKKGRPRCTASATSPLSRSVTAGASVRMYDPVMAPVRRTIAWPGQKVNSILRSARRRRGAGLAFFPAPSGEEFRELFRIGGGHHIEPDD